MEWATDVTNWLGTVPAGIWGALACCVGAHPDMDRKSGGGTATRPPNQF